MGTGAEYLNMEKQCILFVYITVLLHICFGQSEKFIWKERSGGNVKYYTQKVPEQHKTIQKASSSNPEWKERTRKETGKDYRDMNEPFKVTENPEKVPFTVTETFDGYEKRIYPSITWACTEMTHETGREKEGMEISGSVENMRTMVQEMMRKKSWKNKPATKMFMKLFRYIGGLNDKSEKIEMTSPVLSKLKMMENNMMNHQMCFYLGEKHQDNPPNPVDKEITIEKTERMTVLVHTFGGFAMMGSTWAKEVQIFKKKLQNVTGVSHDDVSQFYTASYDSPWKVTNRTNEVMFQIDPEESGVDWKSRSSNQAWKEKTSKETELEQPIENDQPGKVIIDEDETEKVPFTVIQTFDGYEKRAYPSITWACTGMTYEIRREEEGMEISGSTENMMKMVQNMMTKKSWKNKPPSKMFMKLFKYIGGVNNRAEEIEMTSPVLSKMRMMENNMINKQMCFYLGEKHQDNPPNPVDKEITIEKKEGMTVLVHTFGGFAMMDSTWIKQAKIFEEKLKNTGQSVDVSEFYTAGYDSPWTLSNRTNEVMFQIDSMQASFL